MKILNPQYQTCLIKSRLDQCSLSKLVSLRFESSGHSRYKIICADNQFQAASGPLQELRCWLSCVLSLALKRTRSANGVPNQIFIWWLVWIEIFALGQHRGCRILLETRPHYPFPVQRLYLNLVWAVTSKLIILHTWDYTEVANGWPCTVVWFQLTLYESIVCIQKL